MHSIGARLERLEALQPAHIILETVIDGKTVRMTAKQFAAKKLDFFAAKIVSGNSLKDAELLLSMFPSCID